MPVDGCLSILVDDGIASRRAHNALQPVTSLKFDITTRIYHAQADLDPPRRARAASGRGTRLSLGWIQAVTHVYSHWRDCAIQGRLLWAY